MFENIGTDLDTTVTKVVSGVPIPFRASSYLAECSDGSLIVVGRHFKARSSLEVPLQTVGFTVHKIDLLNSSWVEMKSIGVDVRIGFWF